MSWWPILIHIILPIEWGVVFLTNDPNTWSVPSTSVLRISSFWATICPIQWAVMEFVIIMLYYQASVEYLHNLKHL